MTTHRPRVDGVGAPSTGQADSPPTRTRALPSAVSNPAPTTAQLIRRSDASVSRPTYAALGVALHHFTELLETKVHPLRLHRATTLLTKQVFDILDEHDDQHDGELEAIRRLVTDPERTALPDGRTASELCDQLWDEVRATAAERATASCEGAVEFGHDAIVNLAAVRGVGADAAWWGTPTWTQRVELLSDDAISSEDRELLRDEPERADDDLLSMVLVATPSPRRIRPSDSVPITSEFDDADARASSVRASTALAS